jgi:hypothetical protein
VTGAQGDVFIGRRFLAGKKHQGIETSVEGYYIMNEGKAEF